MGIMSRRLPSLNARTKAKGEHVSLITQTMVDEAFAG